MKAMAMPSVQKRSRILSRLPEIVADTESTTLEAIMFWIKIEYIGIGLIPGFWITFCLAFAGKSYYLTNRNLAFLFLVPVTTILMVWTNSWHNLHYVSYQLAVDTPFPMLDFQRGPWYLVHLYFFYGLLILGIILLFRNYQTAAPVYKKQILSLLAGTLIPWFTNALYHLGFRPYEFIDMTPVTLHSRDLRSGSDSSVFNSSMWCPWPVTKSLKVLTKG